MGSYVIRRDIDAPTEAVFRAFADPALVVDWMDAKEIRDASGPLDQSGTTYTLVIFGIHHFRTTVVRSEPARLHETRGHGRFGWYRMVATLTPRDGRTELELLTEYGLPWGPIGRWLDHRFVDREPRTQANREVDRLVELVSAPIGVTPDEARRKPVPA